MHEATLTAGMQFPVCKKCGVKVRFRLIRAVNTYVIPFRSGHILEEYPLQIIRMAKAKGFSQ